MEVELTTVTFETDSPPEPPKVNEVPERGASVAAESVTLEPETDDTVLVLPVPTLVPVTVKPATIPEADKTVTTADGV